MALLALTGAVVRRSRSGQVTVPLAIRVGLAAGDVTLEADDVHGTPVIEASRLCAAARGGEILASDLVRGLAGTGSDAGFESVGSLALLTDMGRIFVGRDAELDRLTQLWKEAAAGERRVVFLAGEPGVGKTRLTAELADRIHEQGGIVLAGRCDEDLGVPYQPFVEALRHFADHTAPDELATRLVARSPEAMRLLILSLYRDAELDQDQPLVQLLADLRREGGIERVALRGLDQPAVNAFVEQVAGHDLDEDTLTLARAIHEETEGNPFFVKEVLRHLAESGAIARRAGRWGTRLPVDELGIPEGVREVVAKRLSRLSAEANRVLRTASVVGTDFEPAIVQVASDAADEELASALEESTRAGLVMEADGAHHRFAHAWCGTPSTRGSPVCAARRCTVASPKLSRRWLPSRRHLRSAGEVVSVVGLNRLEAVSGDGVGRSFLRTGAIRRGRP